MNARRGNSGAGLAVQRAEMENFQPVTPISAV